MPQRDGDRSSGKTPAATENIFRGETTLEFREILRPEVKLIRRRQSSGLLPLSSERGLNKNTCSRGKKKVYDFPDRMLLFRSERKESERGRAKKRRELYSSRYTRSDCDMRAHADADLVVLMPNAYNRE